MASIAKIEGKRGTTWRVDYFLGGNRKSIRLGRMTKRRAVSVKGYIERLIEAKITGTAPDPDVIQWVADRDDDLHAKLALHGLVAPRATANIPTLAQFIDRYIASRTDVKRGTVIWYQQTRRCLVDYFGADRMLDAITPGEAKDFRRWLTRPKNTENADEGGQGLGENTARKRCAIAKQMFADAVDRELISRNPFGKMEGLTVGASDGRDYFVTRDEAQAVLDACPDKQWQLLFALSRYGGLRCPSEHLGLRWSDIDWERGRIVIRSPKTEHHEGKEHRVIPMFPELRPYLEAVRDEVNPGIDVPFSDPVITRYRDTNTNLRTHLLRIIAKAKLSSWPKLFQNLRASRATELAAEFPAHVAAAWMGHSTVVADKHYWRVTDADYDRAIRKAQQNAQQNMAQDVGTDRNASEQECEKPGDFDNRRVPVVVSVLPDGLEPSTY